MMFQEDQRVMVFPHGRPHAVAVGTVREVTSSGRWITVTFESRPPFLAHTWSQAPYLMCLFNFTGTDPSWIELDNAQAHYIVEALPEEAAVPQPTEETGAL